MYGTVWRYIVVNVDEMIQYAYILYSVQYVSKRKKLCHQKMGVWWVRYGCEMDM